MHSVNPHANSAPRAETVRLRPSKYGLFIFFNLLGLFAFPFVCIVATIAFWSIDAMVGAALIAYSVVHLSALFVGLACFDNSRIFAGVAVLSLLAVFLYNRHWEGQPDNSPFSDGIGTVDQHVYGVSPYYRVFDAPLPNFGRTHVDWAAIGINLECVVAAVVVVAVASLVLRRICSTRSVADHRMQRCRRSGRFQTDNRQRRPADA